MGKIFRNILKIPEILYRIAISKKSGSNYLLHIKRTTTFVGLEHISIGSNFATDIDVKIEAWDHHRDEIYSPHIMIGDNVFFNSRTHISAINNMKIGNNVLTGSDVLICDNNHGDTASIDELSLAPQKRKLSSRGPIIIEDNVWIGDKAIILGGVTIGCGAVIGAGTVVTKDIPSYAVAVGNPVRIIKQLK